MGRTPDPRSSLAAWFAAAIREHRERTGLSQEELAKHTNATQSLVSQYETGRQDPTEGFAKACDKAFNTGRFFYLIWWHWKRRTDLDFFQSFVGREQQAKQLRIYQGLVIPGLFQTEAYARAVVSADPDGLDANQVVEDRLKRQRIVGVAEIQALIDENALHRPFGGPEVMCDQLRRLLDVSQVPKVTIQLVPLGSSDHYGVSGTFQVLSTVRTPCAYLEIWRGGRLVEDPAETASLALLWDRIRSRALPVDQSQDKLSEMINAYTVAQEHVQ